MRKSLPRWIEPSGRSQVSVAMNWAVPWMSNYQTFQVFDEAVPYRDLIRVIEIADHAGFDDGRVIPARAAESRPIP